MLIEVIAETVEDAMEAEQGGAGRVELVRDLSRGGLTPALPLIEAVVKAVRIPVRVMLRESESFEAVGAAELQMMRTVAMEAQARGAAGFVVGFLRDGAPNLEAVREVLGSLTGPVTFHRAFDDADRPLEAIAAVAAEARVDRLLTSGGTGAWPDRLARLKALRDAAPAHVTILPGGGVDREGLRDLAVEGFSEAHVGRAARVARAHDGRVSARLVAELVAIATSFTRTPVTGE